MRKLGFFVALATACALVGVAPAAAQPTPEVTAYCEAALTTDKAIEKLFASERPKQKDLQAFQTALTQQESSAPPEVAATVQAAATQVRTAIPNLQNLFEDPSFEQNVNAIDEHRYNSCGYTQIDVTGNEYAFEGLPKTVPAGTVAIRFTDTGAEWHELAIYRVKGKDSVKKIVGLSEKEQRKKLEEVGGTFAMQGQTSYTIAELTKPGRYAVICHLAVGSTDAGAAEEAEKEHAKSHAEEGMYETLTVERGSTTTTSG